MTDLQDIALTTIDGQPTTLDAYEGNVLLIVNVASQCGLTPQYEALERVYEQHRDKGFAVFGFPANNFGAQEPGSDAEIAEFCTTKFFVAFPMFSKISVVGDDSTRSTRHSPMPPATWSPASPLPSPPTTRWSPAPSKPPSPELA